MARQVTKGKRRDKGEGSISWVKSRGKWCARVKDTSTGRYKSMFVDTKGEALEGLKEIKRQIAAGINAKGANMKLKDFLLNEWLPSKATLKQRVYVNYESITRVHLIRKFGHLKLKDLDASHITRAWIQMIAEGKSSHVPHTCQRRLYNALEMARKLKYIDSNPCGDAQLPPKSDPPLRALTTEQKDNVLAYAREHYPEYFSIFYLALETGMRIGELTGLEWRDIDFDNSRLQINRSVYVAKGGIRTTTTPKTTESKRRVTLFEESVDHIKLVHLQQKLDAQTYGYSQTHKTPVFTRSGGMVKDAGAEARPLLPHTVSHAWKRMVRALGEDYDFTRFHDTRHTHFTELILEGTLVSAVQERGGHKKQSTTTDVYKHIIDGVQKSAMEEFEQKRTKKRKANQEEPSRVQG